jgi:SAM-dependent methyltransferase
MNKNWIFEQAERNVSQFDKAMEENHPDTVNFLRDSGEYYARVCVECNYLDATRLVKWRNYLKQDSTVLDLGCGGGWLSGHLSGFDEVAAIYALDSSKYFLYSMMPAILKIMNSREEKIIPVEALFSPLLLEDESLDAVVASSVLHHADGLEKLLKEIRRVLKKDGHLIILNETPSSGIRHFLMVVKAFFRIIRDLLTLRYRPSSPAISSSGYLYDPALGDRDYPLWYWKAAIVHAGFSIVEVIDTHMPTVKGTKGRSLVHFVCRPV